MQPRRINRKANVQARDIFIKELGSAVGEPAAEVIVRQTAGRHPAAIGTRHHTYLIN
jgi:hypothetical protein